MRQGLIVLLVCMIGCFSLGVTVQWGGWVYDRSPECEEWGFNAQLISHQLQWGP